MSCVMPDGAFRSGCDAVTGELRQAWTALGRAVTKVEERLERWGDHECSAHRAAIAQIRSDLAGVRRAVESLEVEVKQMGSPVRPSVV